MNNIEPNSVRKLKRWTNFCIIVAILSSLIGLGFFIDGHIDSGITDKNELGDYIGGVSGSLWSFAGVLLVAVAFIYQQIQIEFQKLEIKEAREDSRKQYFENTFFNLLNLHHRILSNIDIASGGIKTTGSDCFISFYSNLRSAYNNTEVKEDEINRIKEATSEFNKDKGGDLSHYIANVKATIKFVDESFFQTQSEEIDETRIEENKKVYYDIINAQLSSHELVICLYFTILDNNFINLLKKLPLKSRIDSGSLIEDTHYDLLINKNG